MSKKLIGGLAVAAALCMAVPAWAQGGHGGGRDGGYGRGNGHSNGHNSGHSNGHGQGHSNGHGYGHRGGHGYGHSSHWQHRHHVRERYVVRDYWRPAPVYQQAVYPAYPAPTPGIHFVFPDIHIPFFR